MTTQTELLLKETTEQSTAEMPPLLMIFIAAFIAFNLSCAATGPFLLWLSLHHSGMITP
ncbi:MAG TPA: hypothetical protein VKT33_04665 [Candidatus Angelobacter sp.]|nr:hypothetical protein [Candidatus Angelobacter sp.]